MNQKYPKPEDVCGQKLDGWIEWRAIGYRNWKALLRNRTTGENGQGL